VYRAFYDGVMAHQNIIPIPVRGDFPQEAFERIFDAMTKDNPLIYYLNQMNILVTGNLDSGILETDIPEEGNSLIGLFTTYQVVRVLSSPEPLCGAVAGFTMPQYLIGFH
ncbi:MAG: hypothetical protein MR499_12240, partial [Lachnospiraceae bacterium]|nr:hypothetical protein [Lachnospiraceae bacterium]